MTSWADKAHAVIQTVHRSLPETANLSERIRAVDAAYPFGMRQDHPYKVWLKARREYLCRYGYKPKGHTIPESPMERMMRRAGVA